MLTVRIIVGGGGSNSIFVCSPPDFGEMFTKSTDKIRQKKILRFEGSWMLIIDMCVHLKWYVNHIGYDWECF